MGLSPSNSTCRNLGVILLLGFYPRNSVLCSNFQYHSFPLFQHFHFCINYYTFVWKWKWKSLSSVQHLAFPFSRGSSQPRDRTQVSCIAGRFFTSWATRDAHLCLKPSSSLIPASKFIFHQTFDDFKLGWLWRGTQHPHPAAPLSNSGIFLLAPFPNLPRKQHLLLPC